MKIDPSLTVAQILRPAELQDDFTRWLLDKDANGGSYIGAKRLPDGSYAAVVKLVSTEAICLGVTYGGIEKRYCYDQLANLLIAFHQLQSQHDEPTGWLSSRPKPISEDCLPIASAPRDGTYIRAYAFDQFDCIMWCRTAVYHEGGWIEVDSNRDGQPLNPTHWKP